MATIATAEVRVIADTSRFVPDLRRKLRSAFNQLGNQLGDQIVERIDRRISQRLNTVMTQAARTSGQAFTKEFNEALNRSGLSDSLREQLGGTTARRNARRAGDAVADAFGDNLKGTLGRISDDALDAVSFQSAVIEAGRAGNDSAQSFADNFRSAIRSDGQRRITAELNQVLEDVGDSPQIPAIFRRAGANAGRSFVVGADSQFDDLNQGILNALAGSSAIDSSAFFAGQRAGIQYSDGLFESVQERATRRIREAFEEAASNEIPPVFRRMGNTAGTNFVEEIQQSLGTRLRLAFRRLSDSDAGLAGRRFGTRFASAFTSALGRLPGALGQLLNTIIARPLSGLGNIFAEMSSEMVSMAGQALAVVALLEALSGLLFALPAAANVAAAGIAAMIVPLLGTQDAFSEAFGEAENFEEALGSLTRPAQTVARELRAIVPSLQALRLRAQIGFFSQLEGAIAAVADNLLGPLTKGLEGAAGGFGRVVEQIAEFLAQSETAETLTDVFRVLTGIFDALADSTQPFLEGMRILVDEFLPEIEAFEGPLSRIGDEFRDWAEAVTESGAAMEAFERGRDTLDKIFDIVTDISGIFDAMFDAAESVGVDALGSVRDAIADIREEFESVEGQETLGQVFDSLSRIAGVVADVFGAIFANLAELSPEIAGFFEEVGPPIQEMIDGIADGIQELLDSGGTDFFRELATELSKIDWAELGETIGNLLVFLSPLLPFLRGLINGIVEVFQFVSRIFVNLFAFIDNLDANVFQPISEASFGFADWWKELWLEVIPGAIADGVVAAAKAVGSFFTETLPEWFGGFLEFVTDWWEDVQEGWDDLWGGLGPTAEAGLQAAIDTIGAQLAAALGIEGDFTTDFDLNWSSLWDGLVSKVSESFGEIASRIGSGLGAARDFIVNWASGVRSDWTAFWVGLLTSAVVQLASIRNAVSSRLADVRATVSGWISGIRSAWSTFWSGLSSTVQSGLSNVRTRVSNALTGVTDAFRTMYSNVRGVLNNLVNFLSGIVSSIRGLVSRISGYVSSAVSAAQQLTNIDLNPFANGGIVTSATPALVGEAGPEVIIPLTRPQRAVDLVQQSGLLGILASQGALPGASAAASDSSSSLSMEMHVHSQNADPEQVARKAYRMVERRLSGRGLERLT
jgi:phage-related protein